MWVLLKVFPWSLVLLSPAYTLARLALAAVGVVSGRGAASRLARDRGVAHLAVLTVKAYAAALRGLPRVLAERARLRPLRRLDTAGFLRMLDEFRLTAGEAALKD